MKQTDPVPTPGSSKPGREDRPCPNGHMNTSTYISEERATIYPGTSPSSGEKGFSEGKRLGWVLTAGVNLVMGQEGALESRDLQVPARLHKGRWGLGQVASAPSSPAHSCNKTSFTELFCNQDAMTRAKSSVVPGGLSQAEISYWDERSLIHLSTTPSPRLVVSLCLSARSREGPCLKNPGAWVISNT